MKKAFEQQPMGQPSPDMLDHGGMRDSKAAAVDLYGERMIQSYKEFRQLVDDDVYTMKVNPDTNILMIKDKEGKVVLMHEDGIRLEAAYQDWKREKKVTTEPVQTSAETTDEIRS